MSKYGRTNPQVTRAMHTEARTPFIPIPNYTLILRNGTTITGKALLYGKRWAEREELRTYIRSLSERQYLSDVVFVSGYGDVQVADIAQLN